MKIIRPFIQTGKNALGLNQLKKDGTYVVSLGKYVYKQANSFKGKPQHEGEAQSEPRLLSKEEKSAQLGRLALFLKIHAVVLVLLMMYLVVKIATHDWHSAMVCFALVALAGAQVFRYHVNAYRLKNDRLKASVAEWARDTFRFWGVK